MCSAECLGRSPRDGHIPPAETVTSPQPSPSDIARQRTLKGKVVGKSTEEEKAEVNLVVTTRS